MGKIPKNLSDKVMFGGYKEQESFESIFLATEEEPLTRPVKKVKAEDLNTAFLPMALQEKIGKLLLELKVDLYKEGIVDYDIKAKRDGNTVVLSPFVHKDKTKT